MRKIASVGLLICLLTSQNAAILEANNPMPMGNSQIQPERPIPQAPITALESGLKDDIQPFYEDPGNLIAGDTDGDGDVDLNDFSHLKMNFGKTGDRSMGDLNGDAKINLSDFAILKKYFGMRVPEVVRIVNDMAEKMTRDWDLNQDQKISMDDLNPMSQAFEFYANYPADNFSELSRQIFSDSKLHMFINSFKTFLETTEIAANRERALGDRLIDWKNFHHSVRDALRSDLLGLMIDFRSQNTQSVARSTFNHYLVELADEAGEASVFAQIRNLIADALIPTYQNETSSQRNIRRDLILKELWDKHHIIVSYSVAGNTTEPSSADIATQIVSLSSLVSMLNSGLPPFTEGLHSVTFMRNIADSCVYSEVAACVWPNSGISIRESFLGTSTTDIYYFIAHELAHIAQFQSDEMQSRLPEFKILYTESRYDDETHETSDWITGYHPNVLEDHAETQAAWYLASRLVLQLGLVRATGLQKNLIMEKILFLDSYWPDRKQDRLTLYWQESNNTISTEEIPIVRNEQGRITQIDFMGAQYSLTYSENDRLSSVAQINAPARATMAFSTNDIQVFAAEKALRSKVKSLNSLQKKLKK